MKKKGFTLIELMIAVSIFVTISAYLYRTFFTQIRQSVGFNNNIDVQYNVNKALNILADKIRSSAGVTLSGSPAGRVLSNGTVIIDLASNSTSPDIYFSSSDSQLVAKDGRSCSYINSVVITQGASANKENELILITVSAVEGSAQYSCSTAINIRR